MARKKKKRRKRKSSPPNTTQTHERNGVQSEKVDTQSDSFESSPEAAGSDPNVSAEKVAESSQGDSETKNNDAGAPSSPSQMSVDESGEIIISHSAPRRGHSDRPLDLISSDTEEVIKEPRPGMPLVAPPPSSEFDDAAGAEKERDGISEEEITDRHLRLDTDALWVLQPSLRDSKKRQEYERGNKLSSRKGEISGETKPPQTQTSPSNTALSVDFGGDGPTVLVDESYQKLATDIAKESDSHESTTEKRERSGKKEKKLARSVVYVEESETEKTQGKKEQNAETEGTPSAKEERKKTKIDADENSEKIETLPMLEEIAAHPDRDNTPLAIPLSKSGGDSSPIPGSVVIPPLPFFDKPKKATDEKDRDTEKSSATPPRPEPKPIGVESTPLKPKALSREKSASIKSKESPKEADEALPPPPAPKEDTVKQKTQAAPDEPLPPPPAPKEDAVKQELQAIQDQPLPPPPAPKEDAVKQETQVAPDEHLPPPPAPEFAPPPSEPPPPQTAAPMNKVGNLDEIEDGLKNKSLAASENHTDKHTHSPSSPWQTVESKNKDLAKLDSSVRKVAPQKALDDTGSVLLIHPSPFPVATDTSTKEKPEQAPEDVHLLDEKQKSHKADSEQISGESSQAKDIVKEEAKRLEDLVVAKTKKQKKPDPVSSQELKPEPKESSPFTSGILEAKVSSGEIEAPAPKIATTSKEESLQTAQKATLSDTIPASAEEKTLKQKVESKITAEVSDKPIQKTERGTFRKAMADSLQLDMDAEPAPPADSGLKGEVLELKSPEDSADFMSPKNAFSDLEKAFFDQDLEPEPVEDDFTDLFGKVQEPSSVWGWIKSKTTGKTENGKQEQTVKKKASVKASGKSKNSTSKQTKKAKPSKGKTGGKKGSKTGKGKKKS